MHCCIVNCDGRHASQELSLSISLDEPEGVSFMIRVPVCSRHHNAVTEADKISISTI